MSIRFFDVGDRAACAGRDVQRWYSDDAQVSAKAKAICGWCPVRAECLEWALDNDERFGIWGGLSPLERQRIREHTRPSAGPASCAPRSSA
jgi:WhiB family redox-sensing transcriptional regulator